MVGPKRVVLPQTPRRVQTSVFRVQIHCDGCKKKVKKLVQKIKGVESIAIDAQLGKLTVVGYVSPDTVIKKLAKSGKHAEMWGAYKSSYDVDRVNNQFKNMQIDFYDRETEKKPRNAKPGGNKQVQLARKDRKAVKFEFTDEDEDDFYEGEGKDSFDERDDGFELDFGRDSRKNPRGKGSKELKATKEKVKKEKKKRKGGFFGFFRIGRKDKNKGYGGKKGNCVSGPRKSYSREEFNGGKAVGKSLGHVKNGNGNDYGGIMNGKNTPWHGGPAQQGKISEPGFEIDLFDRSKGGRGPGRGRGRGGGNDGPPGRKLAVQPGGYPNGPAQYEAHGGKPPPTYQAQMGTFPTIGQSQYLDQAKVGDASMNQAGMNFPINPAGTNFLINHVPGVPAMAAANSYGAAHYPSMGQGGMCKPQHMAMMGQQQAQWSGMARPMMYGGSNPQPSFGYAPPARYTDRYTLMFNDENTESCSIM